MVFSISRELVEDDERGGRPKSTRNEVNIAAVSRFGKIWSSNRIKNDSRIFEHPQDCSSSDCERGFGQEKVVYMFCSTVLDTWAKGRSSRILPKTLSRRPMQTKFFLTKLLREMSPDVLLITPKQIDRVLNGLVRHPLGRRNWNSKGPASRPG